MNSVSYPGRIGLVKIHGSAGRFIRLGQYMYGAGFEDFEHAFLDLGDGTLIQAEPGGAQIRPLDIYKDDVVHWCDTIYTGLAPWEKASIASHARDFAGVPYSFLDYGALVAHRFGLDTRGLRRYIGNSGHMICSQLVDRAYTVSGHPIFNDGRWDGFVTPGDLYRRDIDASH